MRPRRPGATGGLAAARGGRGHNRRPRPPSQRLFLCPGGPRSTARPNPSSKAVMFEPESHRRRKVASARRHAAGRRRQFRAVLGPRHQGRGLHLRRSRRARRSPASSLPEYTDEVWHGFVPGLKRRRALRLPRPRAVRARARPPLQPEQAAARPLCQGLHGRAEVGRRAVRLHRRPPGRRPELRRARQRALRAQVRGRRLALRVEAADARARALGPDGVLRDPRARLHDAPSGGARAPARHLRRPGARRGAAPHPRARRHQRRAAADPDVPRPAASCSRRG